MKPDDRLRRLAEMARLVLEASSAEMRRAAAAREAVRAQIATLDAARPTEPPRDAAEAGVAFAYETWAGARKAVLNVELAQRQAEWLAQADRTRLALGRTRAIERLAGRPRGGG